MSNATGAFGLKPVRMFNGSPYSGMSIACYVASGYATALYVGDPVIHSNESDDRDATAKRLSVEKATLTDGGVIFGVIVGMDPLVTDLSKQYNAASTERIVHVAPADGIIYQIRGGGGGTPTKLFPGENAVMRAGTASTVFGTSGVYLDEGTTDAPDSDQSNTLYILNVKNVEDNTLGDYAIYEVLINTPYNATGLRLGVVAS